MSTARSHIAGEGADVRGMLVSLSHELGRDERRLAILGEGNTSALAPHGTFWVKASGSTLGTLSASDLVQCRLAPLLEMLDRTDAVDDAAISAALLASRVDPAAKRPSVEAVFHAFLLLQPGITVVGHTHPIAVNQILCSPRAGDFAARRMYPDEIVCCGAASALVPYVDPGLPLARAIRDQWQRHVRKHGEPPRVILLANHGLIAPAASAAGVLAATLMAVKSAEIFNGAATLGGPVFLTEDQVRRIEGRDDEHYRRSALNI